MKRNIVILLTIIIVGGIVFWIYDWQNKPESQLPNPAAVFCLEQGGTLENRMSEAGARGFCLFNDGSECGQWDFFRGDCHQGDLKIEILKEGSGEVAETGDTVTVHYLGTLEDETVFDSSLNSGPFVFTLGEGQVIKGWDQGVWGMKIGEKRKLTIGSALAYGETGVPGIIPFNATLIFEVELLDIAE